jgi:hypothetical protein
VESPQTLAGHNPNLKNLQESVRTSAEFYRSQLKKAETSETLSRRQQLSIWIAKFHQESGTMTPGVKQALQRLTMDPCLLIVTAHQPNFFPYGGVIRKATLIYVLAHKLSQALDLPAVSLFALADQDFTDDRWVKSAQIPDIQRRGGTFELRFSAPQKTRLNQVPKPSKNELDDWRHEIENWIHGKLKPIEQFLKSSGATLEVGRELSSNLEDYWMWVERAYYKAASYSDFNAFLLSMIVDHVWGYDTLFCRFSESQRIFEDEFGFLLSHFERYSQYVKEATVPSSEEVGGVSEQEYLSIPFWYHCSCGGKARLAAVKVNPLIGRGQCVRCCREFEFQLGPGKSELSEIVERISARSIAMPLVFLNGIKACCYVGGAGGRKYLRQANYVARHLGIVLPPVLVWRPLDTYVGIAQLEALMTLGALSGTFDLSQCPELKKSIRVKIDNIQQEVTEIESEKIRLRISELRKEEKSEKIRALGARQDEIRKQRNLSALARNLGLLGNVESVMSLCPSVIDYAINIGLKATSDQWVSYLNEDGRLFPNVPLQTTLSDSLPESLKRSLENSDA